MRVSLMPPGNILRASNPVAVTGEAATISPTLSRPLLLVMAIACGLSIANLYYNQPLLALMARDFHVSAQSVAVLPTLTQIGFAVGVLLLTPLGDVLERRRLILTLLGFVTVALTAAAFAPSLGWLAIASLAIGVTSVLSTLILPFAVSLSRSEERGATVGTIAGAMLVGVLLSRTLSGALGQAFGWRVMYGIAAGLMVLLALILRSLLPSSRPQASLPYPALIGSLWQLLRREPLLRAATVNGMLLFGALSAFWASLVFLLESPAYHYGPAVAGLFGLVGAGSALAAPLAGRLADRSNTRTVVGQATIVMLMGFLLLWAFGSSLWGLIVGIVLLDLAAQAATVLNQSSLYTLTPEAHSRLYTVYRAAYSLGGSAGAFLGVWFWGIAGWSGVCFVGVVLLGIAVVIHYRTVQAVAEQETSQNQERHSITTS